jgi:hypothetical protein
MYLIKRQSGCSSEWIRCGFEGKRGDKNGTSSCSIWWLQSFLHIVLLLIGQIIFSGLGAFTSPFIATQFSQLPRWSFNFLVSLGMAMTNVIFLISIFKLKRQDGTHI